MKKLLERIRDTYWRLIPYDYRPREILYKSKCWAWKRYTTVKSRYLPHTWVDRTEVLPYTMFEILSQFIEKECSPGNIEWYGEYGHKITVDGEEKYVRDEMQELYDWWHKVYNKSYPKEKEQLWENVRQHSPTSDFVPIDINGNEVPEEDAELFRWDPKFATEEDKNAYRSNISEINRQEQEMEKKLDEMLHRLIAVRRYMWT